MCVEEEKEMNDEEKRPRRNWGRSQAEYLAALNGKQIAIVFGDGKAMKGELVGVDTYELFIRQTHGLEVMISKGAIKYLHPALAE
jgi:sRNA-binding regulator protein Hfq